MNPLQRALYRDLSRILASEKMPDGRPLTNREWWQALYVLEVLAGIRL